MCAGTLIYLFGLLYCARAQSKRSQQLWPAVTHNEDALLKSLMRDPLWFVLFVNENNSYGLFIMDLKESLRILQINNK